MFARSASFLSLYRGPDSSRYSASKRRTHTRKLFNFSSLFSYANLETLPPTSQTVTQEVCNPLRDVELGLPTEQTSGTSLIYNKTEFRNFIKKSSESFIEEYIEEGMLVSDLITELLENSNSGGDETVSTTKHILPLFESILTKEVMDLIKKIDLKTVHINAFHQIIMCFVKDKFDNFVTTLLNDSFYKLRKGFVEEFNAKCNEDLSFSQDEVAFFSVFMILDALGDDFFWRISDDKKRAMVAVSYHRRLAEFQHRVIKKGIQRTLLAGGINAPLRVESPLDVPEAPSNNR